MIAVNGLRRQNCSDATSYALRIAMLLATTALSAPALLVPASAQTLPNGGSVAAGSVAIAQPSATQMNITQSSQSAVVNWQGYSVGQGASVNYIQPGATSAILNRVTGSTPSSIAGSITGNGQVYLVNPNGIAITRSGTVSVGGGFVASTLGISDADFMKGNRTFSGTGAAAGVSNAGTITVGRGGYAALIGGTVSNSGAISVPLGKVGLGSGEQATLDFSGDGFLQVAMPTNSGGRGALIKNSGSIKANGGSVIISAATAREAARNAVNISGLVQARSISGHNGAITIGGGDGGRVRITGRLIGTSRHYAGGNVTVTGKSIRLKGATVDASGATGGGAIKIGGDRQGRGTLQRADTTRIDETSVIKADATQSGNGGSVVVWSDLLTSFAGTISAKGGALSGHGGEVEVSSHGTLAYTGLTNLLAANGAAGTLLLDPYDVLISNGINTNTSLAGGTYTPSGTSIISNTGLEAQLALGNVTITTGAAGSPGTDAGNITVAAPVTWSAGTSLTLTAANNVAVNAPITFGGAAGAGLALNAGNALTVAAPIAVNGAGAVSLAYDQNTTTPAVTDLAFGMTTAGTFAGSVTFNAADGSALTASPGNQSLAVNGAPYTLVYNMTDIAGINNALSGNYALATNIDAGTAGTYTGAVVGSFSGTFEGLGNTISNLTIHALAPATFGPPGPDEIGLFNRNSGTLRDFALSGGSVMADSANPIYNVGLGYDFSIASGNYYPGTAELTGAVVGKNGGTIVNVASSAAVTGDVAVGGLVGVNTGTILNSMASGAVSVGTSYEYEGHETGGLVGFNYTGTIAGSWATGAVSGYTMVGGLIGTDINATTASSYATGAVTGTANVGGLIGNLGGGSLQSSYATGAVNGVIYSYNRLTYTGDYVTDYTPSSNVGGLVGEIYDQYYRPSAPVGMATTIADSYATGRVTGAGDFVGGLIGYSNNYLYEASPTTLTGVYATGAVSGSQDVGGLAGRLAFATLDTAYATGAVSGNQAVGGLIGQLASVTVNNASASGAVTGVGSGVAGVGGLIGVFSSLYPGHSEAANISASGAVTAPDGANYVGGLIGVIATDLTYSYTPLIISNASATGAVTVGANAASVGGLIGADGFAGYTTIGGAFLGLAPLFGGGAGGITIDAGRASGAVKAGDGAVSVGGLIGSANDVGAVFAVGNSYAAGSVTVGNNAQMIGGLIGDAQLTTFGLDNHAEVYNVFATGAVTAGSSASLVGGLMGHLAAPEMDAIYATGAVTVGPNSNGVGGLAGGLDPRLGQYDGPGCCVTYSGYSIGRVSAGAGSQNVDASIGANYASVFNSNANDNAYFGISLYYNSDTAGGASAVSHSMTTAQFTDGTVVGALNGQAYSNGYDFSGGTNGLYPYQPALFPTGVQAISGTAYNAYGSAAAGAGVALAGLGSLGQTSTGANGAYYIALPAGTLGATGLATAGTLNAATLTSVATEGQTGVNLYANTLSTLTSATLLSAAPTQALTRALATTAAGSDAAALTTLASATGFGLIGTGASFTIDQSVAASGAFVAATSAPGASLTVAAPVSAIGTVLLQSGGDLTIASGGSVSGASPVLAAAGAFVNEAGSSAVTATSGGWQIFSAAPAGDAFGNLDSGNTAIWNTLVGGTMTASGNRYVFATAPTLTVATVNDAKSYGVDTTNAVAGDYTITGFQAGVAGAYLGDTAATAVSGAAGVTSTGSDGSVGVGSYGYQIGLGTLASSAGYGFALQNNGAFTVNTRAITVTADAKTQTYGNAAPALTYSVGGLGLVNGDTLTGGLATTAGATANVGTYAITQGTVAASSNYALTYVGANEVISARAITVTADAKTQTYGNAVPGLSYAVGGLGLVNGDTLTGTLATTASATANVGTYTITQGTVAASSNYALTYVGANDVISARAITVTADAQTQTYGNAVPTLTYAVGGLVNGDTLGGGLSTMASATANVGSYAITQGTLANGNYAISYVGANDTIGTRAITVTADAKTQSYGNAVPALTYAVGGLGLVNGDTLSGGVSTTASATAGVGSYAITQGTLAASSNYALTYAGASDVIVARTITVTADAQTQSYGNAVPALTYSVGGLGLVNGDALSGGLSTTASATANVGSYAIAQGTLAASPNYALSYVGANDVIGARAITVTADGKTQTYGNPVPTLSYAVGGLGLVNGDTLTGGLSTTASATAGVGSYGITQGTLASSSNYALTYTGANDVIGARAITVTADAKAQTYGSAVPTLTYAVGGLGLVNGDTLSGALATAASATANVGTYAITQGNLGNGNYAITYAGANDVIGARAITVTADAKTQTYGNAAPALTYAVGGLGLVNGDTLSGALVTTANAAANVGSYAITQGSLANTNYAIAYTGANDVIGARAITVTADAKTQTYGNAAPALTYTVGGLGLVNGDTLSGSLSTTASATSDVGSYAISQGTLAASPNYAVSYASANTVIGARPITVTADAKTQTYGNAVPTLTYSVGGPGLVNGDTLSGSLSTAASASANVGAYAITQGTLAASSNYAVTYAGANDVVGARAITVTADAKIQTYGDPVPTLTYAVGGLGLVNGDVLSGALATTASATANVGSYAIAQGTLANGNYAIGFTGANDVIGTRAITVTADARTQTYGNAVPNLTYAVGGLGLVNGDTLSGSLSTTASATANVGTYAITQGSLANGNYAIAYTGANAVIAARAISVTADAKTQIYGNAAPALTYAVGGLGLVNGDALSGSLSTTASTMSNVGSYAITLGSLAASSNYALSFVGASDVIGARAIMVTAEAKTQTYGNAVPTLTYAVGGLGLVNGDALPGALATTATSSSNVGSYAITQGTLAASPNYALTYAGANDVIGARAITVTADAKTQTYGNAVPVLTYVVGGLGLVNGDTLTGGLAAAASATADVGSYAISQGTLANSNYAIAYSGANDVIGARAITVTADAKAQTYGDALPALTYAVGGLGLVNGDTLSGALSTTAGAKANVGTYGITQGTLANSNYAIGYVAGVLTVDPLAVTLAGTQVYNGSTVVAGSALSVANLVGGDSVAVSGIGTMAAKDVGSWSLVSLAGLTLNNANYTLAGGSGAATVTPATLTYVADVVSRTFGTLNPVLSGSVTGFVGNDNRASATTGMLSFTTPATLASTVGAYAIDGTGLIAANGNYSFVQAAANGSALTVTPAAPTVSTSSGTSPQGGDNVSAPSNANVASPNMVIASLRSAGTLPVPPPPSTLLTLSNPVYQAPTTSISTSVTVDSQPGSLLAIGADGPRQQNRGNGERRGKTGEDAGNVVTGELDHAPGELDYVPISANDPAQYSDGKLPSYADRAELAAILATIYRAVAHENAKIDQFFDPATGADWRGVGWNNPLASKVVFGPLPPRAGETLADSAMPLGDSLDLAALLSTGPVLLGNSDGTKWLLAVSIAEDGIVADDPLTGTRVWITYNSSTKMIGTVARLFDARSNSWRALADAGNAGNGFADDVRAAILQGFIARKYLPVTLVKE